MKKDLWRSLLGFAAVVFMATVFLLTPTNTTSAQYQFYGPTQNVAAGQAVMTTAIIAGGACGTTVTVAAPNVVATDIILTSFSTAPNGTQAGLTAWPTAGNVNFAYCGIAETPTAMTINWKVAR